MKRELEWVHGNLINLVNEARHADAPEAEKLLLMFSAITSIAIESAKHDPDT